MYLFFPLYIFVFVSLCIWLANLLSAQSDSSRQPSQQKRLMAQSPNYHHQGTFSVQEEMTLVCSWQTRITIRPMPTSSISSHISNKKFFYWDILDSENRIQWRKKVNCLSWENLPSGVEAPKSWKLKLGSRSFLKTLREPDKVIIGLLLPPHSWNRNQYLSFHC